MAALGWSEPTDKTDPSVSLPHGRTHNSSSPQQHIAMENITLVLSLLSFCPKAFCESLYCFITFYAEVIDEVIGSLDITIQSWSSGPGEDVQLPTNWQFVGFFSICQEVQEQIQDVGARWRLICALTFLASEWIPYKYRKPAASVAVSVSVTLYCECTSYPSIQT